MAFKPTKMQQKAIETEGNVLVAAAAGSGKTAVLVERVIGKLTRKENPVSADRLLVVTFTNAAAAEMRGRIENRLYEECKKHPDNAALIRQKHLIGNADICTIDSFCINLVRENFESCGVEPDFKVEDGTNLVSIGERVLGEIIEEQIVRNSPEFLKLLELTGCEYDESNLKDTIVKIHLYSQQLPFPKNFINELKKPYEMPFKRENPWYNTAFKIAQELLEDAKGHLEKMADAVLYIGKNADKCDLYVKNLSFALADISDACKKGDWDDFYQVISYKPANVPSCDSQDTSASVFKAEKKKIVDILGEVRDFFCLTADQIDAQRLELCKAVTLLCDMITEYGNRLFEAQKKENCLTFSDTEQLALSLLCEYRDGNIEISEKALPLLLKYDEVLVDEFQDVNDLQNTLFYILSNRDRNLFAVGDVKQSIYGFRGSNPKNFLKKKNAYIPIESATDDQPKKIILADNFRSRKGVCRYINYFFSLIMNGKVGELVYNDEERLNSAATFPKTDAPVTELLLVDKTDLENDMSLLEYETYCIAKYIKDTMAQGNIIRADEETLRKANYGDFVILLDKLKDKADVIAQGLKACGIPVATDEAYIETVEISLMLSLLQVIDNPRSDIDLLAVMLSPLYGFTAEELAIMRADCKTGDIYTAVLNAAQNGNAKATEFIEHISDLRSAAVTLSLDQLIVSVITKTDLLNIVSAMDGGNARRNNLISLSKYAANHSLTVYGSISGFVRYMRSLPANAFKTPLNSGENKVRIMTMHASKGLQFPICIIANLASKINKTDSIGRVLYSSDYGISFKYYDEEKATVVDTLAHKVTSKKAYEDIIEERMRLLYVAMTRAEDRLVMVASCKNAASTLERIAQNLTDTGINGSWLKDTQTMNDWIIAGALLHPDSDKLRKLAESKIPTLNTESRLNVNIFNCNNIDVTVVNDSASVDTIVGSDLSKQMAINLTYTYPYEGLREIQAKSSVSAIANKAQTKKYSFTEIPAFMQESGITAADRGTAMHRIMQFISFDGTVDINSELDRLCEWQFITEQQRDCVDRAAIKQFFESEIFKRISESSDVRREMRFLTEVPAKRLNPNLALDLADTLVIVQGAVDLCFDEGDGIVVLDFKSDRVSNEKELADAYGEQLEIYAKACEKIFAKPVKQKIIYSFTLSKEIILQ